MKTELASDLVIPLLGTHPKEFKLGSQRNICILILRATLSQEPKGRSNPSVHLLMNKENMVYSHNAVLFSLKKKKKEILQYW